MGCDWGVIGGYSPWLVEAGVLVAAVGVVTGGLGCDWGLLNLVGRGGGSGSCSGGSDWGTGV